MRVCSVSGCENRHSSNSFCIKHNARFKRNGSPHVARLRKSSSQSGTKEYILENVVLTEVVFGEKYKHVFGPCWIWQGAPLSSGYGQAMISRGTRGRAHVASFIIYGGALSDKKPFVLHKCDVKLCVNPDHLYSGDVHDNSRDREERTTKKKLSDDNEKEIFIKYSTGNYTQVELAKEFNVGKTTIGNVIERERLKEKGFGF